MESPSFAMKIYRNAIEVLHLESESMNNEILHNVSYTLRSLD